jgi:hypothetical protein
MKMQNKVSPSKYKFCTEMCLRHWYLIRWEWFVVWDKPVRYWHGVHLLFHRAHSSQEHVYTNRSWFQFESMLLTHHTTTSLTLICPLPCRANHRVNARQQNIQYLHTPCLLLPYLKLLGFSVEDDRVQYRLSDYMLWQHGSEISHDLVLLTSHFIMATDFVMRFPVSGVLLSYPFLFLRTVPMLSSCLRDCGTCRFSTNRTRQNSVLMPVYSWRQFITSFLIIFVWLYVWE